MLKRTPLFAAHQKLGARLVEFGGWEMPVQYTSIIDEHLSVRRAAGLFDISHMGEFLIRGKDALSFLNGVLTNDLAKLQPGQGQYTLMCNDRGGAIDDLYAYQLEPGLYFLIVNASRIEADFAWLESRRAALPPGRAVVLENISDRTGAVALQGPNAAAFIDSCFQLDATPKPSQLQKNEITRATFAGEAVWISRTGYTGEDGFEIVAPAPVIEQIWFGLLEAGQPHGIKPAGLGARDTLRTEMCYPLHGHELSEDITPIEASVGFFVSFDKGDFTGRSVLESQKLNGPSKKCVPFKMTDKSAPPRPGYPVWSSGPDAARIGEASSGTQSPSLGIGIGLAFVPPSLSQPGTRIEIEIRGKRAAAEVSRRPLYRKPL